MLLVINHHSPNIPYIEEVLSSLKVKYIIKDRKKMFKDFEHSKFKGVILSGGGPLLDRGINFKEVRAGISCLINYDLPILGICLGHELISISCGGEVIKLKKEIRNPTNRVSILKKNHIFKGLPDQIHAYEHHGRYVKNVPSFLEVVATSHKDRIEAVFHKKRPIFGIQFHPERSGEVGKKIFQNFLEICKEY
ncbi:gamma-glutamyl-gamma-aminobutyrate hydrolase family protein [Candidatus Woesearchaeota archaeon]|nr:gamma-glutamyl-gamma-aminobutyrate hydrolase family protein [Candidatus Woesearchaeota archaeon]